MYDTKTFDALAVKKVMFVNVDGVISKIEFAPEYTNDVFNIEVNGLRYGGIFKEANVETNPIDIYELGSNITDITKPILSSTNKTFNTTVGKPLTLETVTAFDNVDGAIIVTRSGSVSFNVVGTYLVTYTAKDSSNNISTITHTYNVTAAPVVVTYDTILVNLENSNGVAFTDPSANMTLMFNKIAYDKTTPALIMFIKVNNITAKLDYAPEYNGRTFEVEIAGVRYIGTFAENESYSSPTIVNI